MKHLKLKTLSKSFIFGLFLLVFIGCEEEETIKMRSYSVAPENYTVAPDTVPADTDSVMIKFNHLDYSGCDDYQGATIVSESENEINLQLILEGRTDVECLAVHGYAIDSLTFSMENRDELEINFLNDDEEKVLTRKIVKSGSHDDFILKLEGGPFFPPGHNVRDTLTMVIHSHKDRHTSEYSESVLVHSAKEFSLRFQNVPAQYNTLYYTFIGYNIDCGNGDDDDPFSCSGRVFYYQDPFQFKRGVPEVFRLHNDLAQGYLWISD